MCAIGRTARRGRIAAALLGVVALGAGACDFINPTNVDNPTTTDEDLANAENPTAALMPGLRAQFARMISAYVVATAVVSDDYSIHGTGIDVTFDEPHLVTPLLVNSTGTSASGVYWNVQELRALGDFVIDEIVPEDEDPDSAHVAEAHYYRAMAYLTLGEVFSHAPHEEDGEPEPASVALEKAVSDLGRAAAFGPQVDAALARVRRLQGDAPGAEAAARSALGLEPDLLFAPPYDDASLPNTAVFFLVVRALQEMQPLPRLDFLDPKYTVRSSPVPVATAEEMHLILAEAALARGDLAAAGTGLENAITIAKTRGTASFDEGDERRNADLSIRPRNSEIVIRADSGGPWRPGLVVDRPADDLDVPHTSATSLDADSVAELSDADDLWHALWLARQEIMLLEGRRLADLGIRLPMMQREIDLNPNIDEGDPGTVVVVPSHIPRTPRYAMDIYTPVEIYDGTGLDAELLETEVTMHVDMNRVLVENEVSPFR
ncbi:MAG: hypothetical protein OXQ94_15080 [Gemmatimonadota bacterium]|nr:hypothetical protein [Gemmatimonadota bacterium]MDE2873000.1 hypothetical protein [Gemmatimonadota bacterium]